MNRIIFLITFITLLIINPCRDIYAQMGIQEKSDTIADDPDDIISIYGDDRKFNFLASMLGGISIPVGDGAEYYQPGFNFQVSAYYLFNRTIGIGTDFQFNNIPGAETYYFYPYNYNWYSSVQGSGFEFYTLKVNTVIGNFHPENKTVFYVLFGVGLQHRTSSSNEVEFSYGAGGGFFYKIAEEIGINGEIQYNKYWQYWQILANLNKYSGSGDGIISLKLGIIYTKF